MDKDVTVVPQPGTTAILTLSNGIKVLFTYRGEKFGERSEMEVFQNALEHVDGTTDYYLNLKLVKGEAYFLLPDVPSEGSTFFVQTEVANVEIRSKEFYLETSNELTVIRCYQGTMRLTRSLDFMEIELTEGQEASVKSMEGEQNVWIEVSKTNDKALKRWSNLKRLFSPSVKWVFDGSVYKID